MKKGICKGIVKAKFCVILLHTSNKQHEISINKITNSLTIACRIENYHSREGFRFQMSS